MKFLLVNEFRDRPPSAPSYFASSSTTSVRSPAPAATLITALSPVEKPPVGSAPSCNIQVAVRVRPPSRREIEAGIPSVWELDATKHEIKPSAVVRLLPKHASTIPFSNQFIILKSSLLLAHTGRRREEEGSRGQWVRKNRRELLLGDARIPAGGCVHV